MVVLLIIQNNLIGLNGVADTHVKLLYQKNLIINLNYMNEENDSKEHLLKSDLNFTKIAETENQKEREARIIQGLNVTINELKEIVKLINSNPDIRNLNSIRNHLYQSTVNGTTFLVVLIQIHSRLNYLKELINSLKNTKFIEQTLVVFSHDVYDPEMNKLIESIDFCATLQIFYPYSMQLYPNKFPGQDPNDCPKSIDKAK